MTESTRSRDDPSSVVGEAGRAASDTHATTARRRRLRPYQRAALQYALRVKHPALFLDMRLGKTLVAIRRVQLSGAAFILVVAPYSALGGWAEQLSEEGESSVLLTGTKAERLKLLEEGWCRCLLDGCRVWCLANKEAHRVIGCEVASIDWHAVILDESTFIKSPPRRNDSKRFGQRDNTTKYYLKHFARVSLRMILTGTPAPESELEYFCQLRFLDPEILPFNNYYEYRHAWFTRPVDDPQSHQWFLRQQARAWLAERLSRYTFALRREDVGMGGEKVYRTRTVQLPDKAHEAYETVEREFVLELDGVEESTIWATQKFIWLRRLAGGCVPERALVHTAKLDELVALLQGELAGQQVVVWAAFVEEIVRILDRLWDESIISAPIYGGIAPGAREDARLEFAEGRTRVLVCQPECFRHGVDLGVADTMIYYSTPLGLETREQTEDRIIRAEKRSAVLIIDLVAERTVDVSIRRALRRKAKRSEMLRELVEDMRGRTKE